MRVFHHLKDLSPQLRATAVAIGNFDGCHLGHQSLLGEMKSYADKHLLDPTVLTFYPHPIEVLTPGKKLYRLMTTAEKLSALQNLQVVWILVSAFDETLARLSPEQFFINYLKEGLKAKSIHVGYNFTFGHKKSGNIDTLQSLCNSHGIHLQVLPQEKKEGLTLSSTQVRNLLIEGKVELATALLGKTYRLSGQVKRGEQRGKELGFPTANLNVPIEKLIPKEGVYLTRAKWQHQKFLSITNIGTRPTFQPPVGIAPVTVEVHLIDFPPTRLYEEFLEIELLNFIREEQKFESVDLLKKQIKTDIEKARQLWSQK